MEQAHNQTRRFLGEAGRSLFRAWDLWILVVIALMVRLYRITDPFIDRFSWRQSDVAMIARNLYLGGFDVFHPQVDWSAHTTGVVGTEFPLPALLAAFLYNVLGLHDWIGRAIPAVIFCISIVYFYLLIEKLSSHDTAIFAAAFYAFTPLSIIVSRSFMPDPLALSFAVAGLYYFLTWTASGKATHLSLAALSVAVAILTKAPYAVLLGAIAYVVLVRFRCSAIGKRELWLFGFVALGLPLAWYVHALGIPTAVLVFGDSRGHFFGEQGVGMASGKDLVGIARMMFWPYFTPVVLFPAAIGLFSVEKSTRYRYTFHAWLSAVAIFVLLVAGPGNRMHPWYQLVLIPVSSAFAAAAISRAFGRLKVTPRYFSLATAMTVSILCLVAWFGLRDDYKLWNTSCYEAAVELDRMASPSARVLVAGFGDPSCLYYTKRKGWHFYNPADDRDAIQQLEQFRQAGARWLILDSNYTWWLDYYKGFAAHVESNYRRRLVSDRFIVLELEEHNP